ncbi:MAG TPA: hypothetical protein VF145_12875 [Chitinophagaceae bacterium]
MKRTIIGAIVGGLLIFIWQSLSWTILDCHRPANKYTPNEAAILQALAANLPEEGGYMVPGMPEHATKEERQKIMEQANGKPWASIQYHTSNQGDTAAMIMNMVRLFLSNVIMVWLLMWIFNRLKLPSFGTIFAGSVFVGLITFINQPYTGHIWFDFFDIWAYLIDALVSWALCGLWLGYLYNRKPRS